MPVLMEEQTYNFREIFFASDECGQDLPTECSGADSSSAASSGEQGLAWSTERKLRAASGLDVSTCSDR